MFKFVFLVTLYTAGGGEGETTAVATNLTGAECIRMLEQAELRDPVIAGFRSCEIDRAPEFGG